jgi:hypothetical protein
VSSHIARPPVAAQAVWRLLARNGLDRLILACPVLETAATAAAPPVAGPVPSGLGGHSTAPRWHPGVGSAQESGP